MTDNRTDLNQAPAGAFTRLKSAPSDLLVQYQYAPSWPARKPMFPASLLTSMAWVVMLAEQEIVSKNEAGPILRALLDLEKAGADAFSFDARRGDLYFNIESAVIEQVGIEAGGRLYTGRSRVDGEPTVKRVFMRDRLLELAEALTALAQVCLDLAEQHTETVMPGYTGTQPAQPWTFGHYLLSFVDAFGRDFDRVRDAFPRVNLSLLGGSAGAGTDLPIDRQRVADLLGCDGLIENSREFGSAVDGFAEVVAVCSILLGHFGQIAHDLHTWCTQEFGLIELGDDFSGSSSFMPQKKNPIPFHAIRATASASVGLLPSVLGVMRTSSQDFDLTTEGIVGPVVTGLRQAIDASIYLAAALGSVQVHAELMRARALSYWTTTSEIPTLILRERGIPWRTAHRVTERFVRLALEEGKQPHEITGEMLDRAAVEIAGEPLGISTEKLRAALDPLEFVRTRRSTGSPNPTETKRMLANRREVWAGRQEWCTDRRQQLSQARADLDQAMAAVSA